MTDTISLQNQKGFTLIETMLAISIMAIGLLGLAALQTIATNGNALAKKNSLAVALAEDKIESYKNTLYANIIAGVETETDLPAGAIYTRTTNIEDDTPIPGVKTITVTVAWQNAAKTVSFTTIISQNGV
jgi:prepilin-type N-terminal cleavage/methylation domain-containing protein